MAHANRSATGPGLAGRSDSLVAHVGQIVGRDAHTARSAPESSMTEITQKSTEKRQDRQLPLLVSQAEAARLLGLSPRTFRDLEPALRAAGLQVVTIPSPTRGRPTKRYRVASLERLVERAATTERPLCK